MDILIARAPYGLKYSGRAFWKRDAHVRIEVKEDNIPDGENSRDEGEG